VAYTQKGDTDAKAYSENLLRLVGPRKRLPNLIILPEDDMQAFAEMPKVI
jgi:hypothetical protein